MASDWILVGGPVLGFAASTIFAGAQERYRERRADKRAALAAERETRAILRLVRAELAFAGLIYAKSVREKRWWTKATEPRTDEWTHYRHEVAIALDKKSHVLDALQIIYAQIELDRGRAEFERPIDPNLENEFYVREDSIRKHTTGLRDISGSVDFDSLKVNKAT